MADVRIARDYLWLALAGLAVVVSAVGVVYSVHISRQMVNELQSLQRAAESTQVQWGQLLLEKSAWGSYAHVERTAQERLAMYVPAVKEIVVVGP
jgi:cell division protein FtsL